MFSVGTDQHNIQDYRKASRHSTHEVIMKKKVNLRLRDVRLKATIRHLYGDLITSTDTMAE